MRSGRPTAASIQPASRRRRDSGASRAGSAAARARSAIVRSLVRDDVDVDRRPASRITRLITEPRDELGQRDAPARTEHELGGASRPGRARPAPRPRRRRPPRGSSPPSSLEQRAGALRGVARGQRRGRRRLARARRELALDRGGDARRPPDQVVAAGRAGDGDHAPARASPTGRRCRGARGSPASASSTRSATHSSASSRSAARLPGAEVVAERGVDLVGPRRCCRGPSGGAAPRASCRPARSARRPARRRRAPSPAGGCR